MNCKTCGHKVTKLKVGDRVEARGEVCWVDLKGRKGIVKLIEGDYSPVLVEFDKPFRYGHDGDGRCKDGHGRWGEHEDFKAIKTKRRGK